MLLPEVEYARPASVEEAISLLGRHKDAKVLAGGQSLVNVMKLRLAAPGLLVDLNGVQQLREIREDDSGAIRIGAMATYRQIAESETVGAFIPTVAQVAGHIADRQVRNRGTIGGNCCFNDPTSNFPPLLTVMNATFEVRGADGTRTVAGLDFFQGPYRTAVRQGEMLQSITVPVPAEATGTSYLSLRIGDEGPALLHASAQLQVIDGKVTDARVAVGCVAQAPLRLRKLEASLIGAAVETPEFETRLSQSPDEVVGLGDVHASAGYRSKMAQVYARRAILQAALQALEESTRR